MYAGQEERLNGGFEIKYLSPKVLIFNMDMHENVYVSAPPSTFLLLGASASETSWRMLSAGVVRGGLRAGLARARGRAPPPPSVFHRTEVKLFVERRNGKIANALLCRAGVPCR